jgi:hypothetical protein
MIKIKQSWTNSIDPGLVHRQSGRGFDTTDEHEHSLSLDYLNIFFHSKGPKTPYLQQNNKNKLDLIK